MGSLAAVSETKQPHAVCFPFPAQGHINPMLKVAKLLHHQGFHITFVNTDFNHHRLLKSRGPSALPSFRFVTIPDGLPFSDADATQDIPSLCESTRRTCLPPFRQLLATLNASDDVPPVSCVVSDGVMSFTLDAAQELGIPNVLFWTTSACGFLAYLHYRDLVDKSMIPLQDESYLTNGYLDTVIDWIPGMQGIRLKDIPTFIRTTDPNDFMIEFILTETERVRRASAVILNTFDALEHDSLHAISSELPCPVYSIGSLELLVNQLHHNHNHNHSVQNIGSNLWKEDTSCLEWLDTKEPNSVVYVNFGSIAVMTNDQLIEFAWGLANSNKNFLWVVRPDLVAGDSAVFPPEFVNATQGRGLLARWCPQVQVLNHPAVGGFLTHCGWNSTLESVCAGVAMICWPFFAEQQTNCRYCCTKWGIGMEIDSDAKRGAVEALVLELMEGEKGEDMKSKTLEWKNKARDSAAQGSGSSMVSFNEVVQVLLSKSKEEQFD